jgi:hypothetical protein
MTEFNGAVSEEEEKTVAITTKIVLNLMKRNDN